MATKTRPVATDRRSVSHQLREMIEGDDRTAYALGRDAGVDPGVIQRFLNRERGLTLETVDRLALALGLRLVETGRGRGRPSKPPRPGPHRPGPAEGEEGDGDPESTPGPSWPPLTTADHPGHPGPSGDMMGQPGPSPATRATADDERCAGQA